MLIPPLLGAAVGGTAFIAGLHLLTKPVGDGSARRQRRMGAPLVLLGVVLAPTPFLGSGSPPLGLLQLVIVLSLTAWLLRGRRPAVSPPVAAPR